MAAQLGLVGVPTPLHRPNMAAAATSAVRSVPRLVDLGFVEGRHAPGRHFVMAAGVGLDAAVTAAVEGESRDLKKVLGPAVFGAVGLRAILGTTGTPCVLRSDGRELRLPLLLAVVSNIRLYGGTLELTPEAALDDGLLDIAVFSGAGPRDSMAHLGAVLAHRGDVPGSRFQSASVEFATDAPVQVQLDGDPFGTTPVRCTARAGRLWLLVPPEAPDGLFRSPPDGAARHGLVAASEPS
jgi:diacylglycerol kinase family enzyme